ncbi:MAG TPA: dihydrofolate reductase family protein [Treponemataceae bacterium]|nr:dihydrofolate reductase family protein [Treponemataceae bacterium]HPS42890.1 dihydrofolate reductase family protein [Treponemataceae bacterium]
MIRPKTTLFMLMSVDGKISTGSADDRDVDKDFPRIAGIKEGLGQYYELEQTTDLFSMNSGKVLAKVGANEPKGAIEKIPVSFIIIDNEPHLSDVGVDTFIRKAKNVYIVTTNGAHPAFRRKDAENLRVLRYRDRIDFPDLFRELKETHQIESMTIQTGGTLNAVLLREKLIDSLSIVVAPALIGGKDTATLIDGPSLREERELSGIKALRLVDARKLENSYLHLRYDIVNETELK